ncbi:hypothetical protein [Amphibacillus indicireducens]|uniref:Uncharacterized protein n=1 Tax=Amphibacillus indicireducens TaxID=1076330 RepID=A0ABP7VT90_9BACI
MIKFVGKLIVIILCFVFVVTLLNQQESTGTVESEISDPQIVMSSRDYYNDLIEVEEQLPLINNRTNQKSITYSAAQWIEKSGLMIYEGLLTIINDLAEVF